MLAVTGLHRHAKSVAEILGVDYAVKPQGYDTLYQVGCFFTSSNLETVCPGLVEFHGNKIIHFIGGDVKILIESPHFVPILKTICHKFLCVSEWLKDDLAAVGIDAHVVPIPPRVLYHARPIYDRQQIGIYSPSTQNDLYNTALIAEIAQNFPEIDFVFYNPFAPPESNRRENIVSLGRIVNMNSFLDRTFVTIRYAKYDGFPLTAVEFMLANRWCITNLPLQYALTAESKNDIIEQIKHAIANNPPKEQSEFWRKELNHKLFKERIMEYANH